MTCGSGAGRFDFRLELSSLMRWANARRRKAGLGKLPKTKRTQISKKKPARMLDFSIKSLGSFFRSEGLKARLDRAKVHLTPGFECLPRPFPLETLLQGVRPRGNARSPAQMPGEEPFERASDVQRRQGRRYRGCPWRLYSRRAVRSGNPKTSALPPVNSRPDFFRLRRKSCFIPERKRSEREL